MFEWNLSRYGDVGGSYMSEDSEVEEEEEFFPGKLDPHSVGCCQASLFTTYNTYNQV